MKPGVHRQDPFPRPTPVPVRAFLGRNRPIRPPATMAGDLPRHNRLMPPKNHRDRPTRQPTRKPPRNHLPFLHAQHHTPHPTPLATHNFLDNHRRYPPTYPLAHSPYDCKPYRRRTATGRAMPFTFRRLLGEFNPTAIDRFLDPMQCHRHRPNTRAGSRLDVSSRSICDRAIRRVEPVDPFAARREHRFTYHPTRRNHAAQR